MDVCVHYSAFLQMESSLNVSSMPFVSVNLLCLITIVAVIVNGMCTLKWDYPERYYMNGKVNSTVQLICLHLSFVTLI